MSLQPFIAGVAIAALASAAGMAFGAAGGSHLVTALSALAFVVVVLAVAGRVNRAAWIAPAAGALFHTMRRNMRLAALVYAWAGASFFAIYTLSGVTWQHGLQYGSGATLIAAGFIYAVHRMGSDGAGTPPSPSLNVLHGLAVASGLVFLLGAGKMQSLKGDWPANYIFLFGGIALVGLCALAFLTQRRLGQS